MEELQYQFQKLQADIEKEIRGREESMTAWKEIMEEAEIHLIKHQVEKIKVEH